MADFDKAEAKRNAVPVKNLTECSFYERKNEMECKDFEPSIIQEDKILKVAKRLKQFTLDDIIMFCEIDENVVMEFLTQSENIKVVGNKFEYVDVLKTEYKLRVVDKNINCQNSDITVVEACEMFLNIKQKTLTSSSFQAYKTGVYSKIIPYFKRFQLRNVTISDIQNFKKYLQKNKVSERRIRNILCLLNQIIKYFQNEGYIKRTCVFEVKRLENIPKREVQFLTKEQLNQLFRITKKKYPYLLPIIKKVITLKQPLNTILIGSEQDKNRFKHKIRKDFYKIKQELGLCNYMFDDLRFIKC